MASSFLSILPAQRKLVRLLSSGVNLDVMKAEGLEMSDRPEPPVVPVVKVDWYRSLTGWYPLMRSLPLAWRSSWLLPALVGVLLTHQVWELGGRLFSEPVTYWGSVGPQDFDLRNTLNTGYVGVWRQWLTPFSNVAGTGAYSGQSWSWTKAATISFGTLGSLLIWSAIGGWIARRSVVELGTRSTEEWGATWKVVRDRWISFVLALLSPIGIILALLAVVWLIGALAKLGSIGVLVSSILMIPALLLLFPITRVAMNWALGLPLLFSAVATEKKADGFEGFSRGFAYISQAPIPMLIAVLIAQAISLAGETALYYGIATVWSFIAGTYIWGAGASQAESIGLITAENMPLWMIIGNNAAFYLSRAFCFSYFFTASTAIYLILRNTVDQTDIDQIDLLETSPPQELPEVKSKEEVTAKSASEGSQPASETAAVGNPVNPTTNTDSAGG
jgi:hypothetical protein